MSPHSTDEHTSDGPRPYPGAENPAETGLERRASDGPARWKTVLVIVAAVLVILLFIALHLTGAVGPSTH